MGVAADHDASIDDPDRPFRRLPATPTFARGGSTMSLDAEALHSSLEVITAKEPLLTRRFYEILFARYPVVRPLFSRNAPERQAKMLQEAIVAVLDHLDDAAWLQETLGAMGAKHVDYGVTEQMYPWVGESLLATLEELAGPAWTPRIEKAWTDAINAIAGLMIAGARRVTSSPNVN